MRASTEIALLGAVAASGMAALAWVLWNSKRDPAERELRRRSLISLQGRMGDGYITDVSDTAIYYTYCVRGVEYAASQDITTFRETLPEKLESLIGPVTLKFLPNNPGNSIVVCESWRGVRKKPQMLLKQA